MVANRQMYDPRREEVFHIAGDAEHGVAGQYNLNSQKIETEVRYKDRLLTVDVYQNPVLAVHVICPRCLNSLWISSERKTIDWDPLAGKLSIEPFQCTWELGRSDATRDDRIAFGMGLCRWTVGIDNNIARDA